MNKLSEPIWNWTTVRMLRSTGRLICQPKASQASMRQSLLKILAVAHNEGLESSRLISNLALEFDGQRRRHLVRLADRLNQDVELPVALEQSATALTKEDVLAIRFGYETGTLQQAFRMLQSNDPAPANGDNNRFQESIAYALGVAIVTMGVFAFFAIFIAPMLQVMIDDFGIDAPATKSFIGFLSWSRDYGPIVLVCIVAAVVLVFTTPMHRSLQQSLRDWDSSPDVRSAGVMRLLASALRVNHPLDSAISTLAKFHYDTQVRNRLLWARNEMEYGTRTWQCLAEAGVLTPSQAQGLVELESDQLRVWALEAISARQAKQSSWNATFLIRFIPVFSILALAALVTWFGYAMLSFLTALL